MADPLPHAATGVKTSFIGDSFRAKCASAQANLKWQKTLVQHIFAVVLNVPAW